MVSVNKQHHNKWWSKTHQKILLKSTSSWNMKVRPLHQFWFKPKLTAEFLSSILKWLITSTLPHTASLTSLFISFIEIILGCPVHSSWHDVGLRLITHNQIQNKWRWIILEWGTSQAQVCRFVDLTCNMDNLILIDCWCRSRSRDVPLNIVSSPFFFSFIILLFPSTCVVMVKIKSWAGLNCMLLHSTVACNLHY